MCLYKVSGLLFRTAVIACLTLFGAACLPDPVINVPDLGTSTSDASMAMRLDGPRGDLGTSGWNAYGTVAAAPTLRAAWVADAGVSQAFLVGHGGVIFHRSGDGAWQAEASGTDANLYAIAARSAAEVYAVGDRGVILRRVGGTWQPEGAELHISSALYAVTVLPNGVVVAVGDQGVVALRQLAGVWALEPSSGLAGTSLRAVWGPLVEGLYTVGMGGVIASRVGGTWQRDKLPIDSGGIGNYYAITGSPSGSEVYIAGEYGLLLHRASDKSRWLVEVLSPPAGMTAPLHLFSLLMQDGQLLVAGAGGTIALRKDSASPFGFEATGTANDLYGLGGAGLHSIVAVGAHGAILRRL